MQGMYTQECILRNVYSGMYTQECSVLTVEISKQTKTISINKKKLLHKCIDHRNVKAKTISVLTIMTIDDFFFFNVWHVYWPSKYQSKDNHRTVLLLATIFFFYKINITQLYWPSWPSTIYLKKYITHVYWPSKYQSKDNHWTVLLLATIFF